MIVDTDVLIWYLRGSEKALKVIEDSAPFHISVVTYIELVQGMRNRKELQKLRKTLHALDSTIIYIDNVISSKAAMLVEEHFLSLSLQLADAIIGATASQFGETLITGNYKHYKAIKDLQIKQFRP